MKGKIPDEHSSGILLGLHDRNHRLKRRNKNADSSPKPPLTRGLVSEARLGERKNENLSLRASFLVPPPSSEGGENGGRTLPL